MYEDNGNYQRWIFKKNLVMSSREDGNGPKRDYYSDMVAYKGLISNLIHPYFRPRNGLSKDWLNKIWPTNWFTKVRPWLWCSWSHTHMPIHVHAYQWSGIVVSKLLKCDPWNNAALESPSHLQPDTRVPGPAVPTGLVTLSKIRIFIEHLLDSEKPSWVFCLI